jgi:hypothetical protein
MLAMSSYATSGIFRHAALNEIFSLFAGRLTAQREVPRVEDTEKFDGPALRGLHVTFEISISTGQ